MNAPLHKSWTQQKFFAWEGHQEGRFEFDGLRPVAMTGGTANHGIIMRNLHRALDTLLRGSECQYLGPDAGLATIGDAVRYPDALVTCAKFSGTALTIPGVIVVFEIVSPGSSLTDRIVKMTEYGAVATIRRYVIIESTDIGVTVFERSDPAQLWTESTLQAGQTLLLPEVNGQIPVDKLYERTDIGPVTT